MSTRRSPEGTGLLARNLVRLVRVIHTERHILLLLQAAPQTIDELAGVLRLPKHRLTRYLTDLKRRGLLACHHPRSYAIWAYPGHEVTTAGRRRARPVVGRPHKPGPRASWWVTPSRTAFQHAAQERAREGWTA